MKKALIITGAAIGAILIVGAAIPAVSFLAWRKTISPIRHTSFNQWFLRCTVPEATSP